MNRQGFTLIEVMIVVVIIGILAAFAVPRFNVAAWKTREKEAETILKHIYTMQGVYYADRGSYANTVENLRTVGFETGTLSHYEPVTATHLTSNSCLNSLTAGMGGKRIDFASGAISDC